MPALVAEELVLQQIVRYSSAIHRQEFLISLRAVVVDSSGNQLFTGATFPKDQHRRACRSNFPHQLENCLHGRAFSDYLVEIVTTMQFPPQPLVFQVKLPIPQELS
jgi:hypothetical protein